MAGPPASPHIISLAGPPLWRVARRANPFPWRYPRPLPDAAPAALTSDGRFNAPSGEYATLYLATEPYAAFLEILAYLTPSMKLHQRIDASLIEEPDPAYDFPVDIVPSDLPDSHVLASVQLHGDAELIDLDHPDTLAALRDQGSPEFFQHLHEAGVDRIDRGVVYSRDRRVTRRVGGELYRLFGDQAAGIQYPSALDRHATCLAIWDVAASLLARHHTGPIDLNNTELQRAVATLGLVTS